MRFFFYGILVLFLSLVAWGTHQRNEYQYQLEKKRAKAAQRSVCTLEQKKTVDRALLACVNGRSFEWCYNQGRDISILKECN